MSKVAAFCQDLADTGFGLKIKTLHNFYFLVFYIFSRSPRLFLIIFSIG